MKLWPVDPARGWLWRFFPDNRLGKLNSAHSEFADTARTITRLWVDVGEKAEESEAAEIPVVFFAFAGLAPAPLHA